MGNLSIAARLSRDIYLDRMEFEAAALRYGVLVVEFFDHAGTQAALCQSRDMTGAFLVFRGTEATKLRLLDIVANLKVAGQPWSGIGWAHAGYVDALGRVSFKARMMAEKVNSAIPLYATGHSLGGALATLYAAWVSGWPGQGHRLAGLVTFGAPKAATAAAFVGLEYTVPVSRFVMQGDIVPWLPPLAFAHPGPAIVLEPLGWWPGFVTRHSVSGYATATDARVLASPAVVDSPRMV